MSVVISGTGICSGIAVGKAHIVTNLSQDIPKLTIPEHLLEQQVLRYKAALTIAKLQLADIRNQIPDDVPDEIQSFIDTHLLILSDTTFVQGPIDIIYRDSCNAEWALNSHKNNIVEVFQQMDDQYLQTREDDINHLVGKVLDILLYGVQREPQLEKLDTDTPHVLITHDVSIADLVLLKAHGGVAIVTERGGPTSHTAILARSLNIPAIFAATNISQYLRDQENIIVDGTLGVILVQTEELFHEHYLNKYKEQQAFRKQLAQTKSTPTETADRKKIQLRANIELPNDLKKAQNVGANGIGLYRTEFLFINNERFPDETEQLHAYLSAVTTMAPEPVTIRTVDLGNDKTPAQWQAHVGQTENPALGLRGVRLCLKERQLFHTQLRAILRASALGSVQLLLPMLSTIPELERILHIIEEVKLELTQQGFAYDPHIKIGGMIEVPAAAIIADQFAARLDFIAIGTNDLIQYTLAIDRNNDAVSYIYDPLNPAILKLLENIQKAGTQENVPVCLCGEMANDIRLIPILLGLGLSDFSVPPSHLLEIKQAISEIKLTTRFQNAVKKLLSTSDPAKIEKILHQLLPQYY